MMVANILKKIAVLGCTLTVVSSAFAYDLSSYPDKFITNGNFDGKIVLGQEAKVEDLLGAIDITASLQANTVTKTLPLYHGIVLSGDAKAINGGKLQLRKKPGTTLTANDIKAFAKGKVTTSKGATDYTQYLRVGTTGLQQITSNYLEHDDALADYFVLTDGGPFFEWEIRFLQGLESERQDDGTLQDLEDKQIALVGMNATIVSAKIADDGTDFTMTLMGGNSGDTLREGETKTYTVDGKDYEVTLVFVSDPHDDAPEAKFSVNGELTDSLGPGETYRLDDGTEFGVRDILVNAREGAASFYLGAKTITITDPTPTVENFDGTVEVNNDEIGEGVFQVMGNFNAANNSFRIAWMKYQYTARPKDGSTVYMPSGQLLSHYIERPEGMLSDIDFHYHGILPGETKNLSITRDGEDQYRMSFFNNDGKKYEFPLLSNKDSVWKYGDEDHDLIFVEGANGADHNIGEDDYFILSNNRGSVDADKSVTHVLQYVDYDRTSLTLSFKSQSDGSLIDVPISSDGVGYLIPGAHTYKVNVSSVTDRMPNLSIDLDADGAYGHTVKVVTYGGVIVNLAQNVYLNDSLNGTLATSSVFVGNGKSISAANGFQDGSGVVQMNAQVLGKKFDTPGKDESFNWTIFQDDDKIDLAMASTAYDGPLKTDFSNENTGFIVNDMDDDSTYALTDYGILIQVDNSQDASELHLNIPQTQRYTQMFVSIGEVIHGNPAPTEKVNPIAVGMAVLDKDATLDENMIVVGGPCVNSIARELLATENCADGFKPGEGFIQSFEHDGKIAILVAGYDATDTLRASRALAQYKASKLKGDKVLIPAGGDK